jgi:hypothetical protein
MALRVNVSMDLGRALESMDVLDVVDSSVVVCLSVVLTIH